MVKLGSVFLTTCRLSSLLYYKNFRDSTNRYFSCIIAIVLRRFQYAAYEVVYRLETRFAEKFKRFVKSLSAKMKTKRKFVLTSGVLALVGEALIFDGSGDIVFRSKGTLCGRGGKGDLVEKSLSSKQAILNSVESVIVDLFKVLSFSFM